MKHGRYTFTTESVYRALQHHEHERRITFLSPPGEGQPKFRIRLAASYDMDVLEYSVREAYMLNLGLTTIDKLNHVIKETGR